MSPNPTQVQSALLFIPDISGFTQFVSDTAIEHSRHIVEELLEILIEANDIGLKISEIEGDAILFYRFGPAPAAAELLAQVQKMFVRFHAHLKRYATQRICGCGACRSAHELTLKFVAHYGDITENKIKSYSKLFGKEVIVAHRLLKNGIQHHEYALFTQNLARACSDWAAAPQIAWTDLEYDAETYDSGPVEYGYLALAPLLGRVPEPTVEDHSIAGLKEHLIHSEATLEAPVELIFNVVADLPWRTKWIPDSLEEAEELNHHILQNGSTHRCLVNGPTVVTHDFKQDLDTITFTETDQKRSYCVVYTLKKMDRDRAKASADLFMKKSWLKNTLFRLFAKRKMLETYRKTWGNLNGYCRSLLESDKAHPYRIVLAGEEESGSR